MLLGIPSQEPTASLPVRTDIIPSLKLVPVSLDSAFNSYSASPARLIASLVVAGALVLHATQE